MDTQNNTASNEALPIAQSEGFGLAAEAVAPDPCPTDAEYHLRDNRHTALYRASELHGPGACPTDIVATARLFEAFLNGK